MACISDNKSAREEDRQENLKTLAPLFGSQILQDMKAESGGDLHQDQEEKDSKKLRRKQSNRESARRSRQRKQAESQALTSTVSDLQQENLRLRAANKALAAQVEELTAKLEEKSRVAPSIFRPVPRKAGAYKPVPPASDISLQNSDTWQATSAVCI